MAGVSLQERGWFLSDEGLDQCSQNGRKDPESVIKVALDIDLREISKGWLPEVVNRGKADYVQGPGVLQLQKIRNVSAPKDNEESQHAPRLMKLVLTDGQTTCSAVETELLKDIGSNTPPGSKFLLMKTVDVEHGFLLLNNKNTKFLGGRVEKLAEGWELKKKLAKQTRSNYGNEGMPPPFVPFGQRIGTDTYKSSSRRDNFKSLEANKAEKKAEDDEFEQQRKATIAEALQAKEDGMSKKFGGGQKQITNDRDVARIMEMGFRSDEASNALRVTNGNVSQAIEYLLKNKGPGVRDKRPVSNTVGVNKPSSYDTDRGDRGRGRRDRRDEDSGPGRGKRGRDTDDSSDVSSKPSAPATLFDFLALSNKIPDTKESENDKKNSGKDSSSRNNENKERLRTTSGGSDHSGRPKQQAVPPRFVNKSKQEYQGQNRRQGQGRYQDDRSERSQQPRDDRPKTAPAENRRYDNRGQNDRSKYNDDQNRYQSDRNRPYNDQKYNDGEYRGRGGNDSEYRGRGGNDSEYRGRGGNDRDYRGRGGNDSEYRGRGGNDSEYRGRGGNDSEYRGQSGRNEDKNYRQSDHRSTDYSSKSGRNSNQRPNKDGGYSRGSQRNDQSSANDNQKSSSYDSQQKPRDQADRSKSRTSQNEGGGVSRNNQSQGHSDSRQNQSSANTYKQDSYSKGDNSNKTQTNYSNNNRNSNSQQNYTGNNRYVQNVPNPSGNYRNYNNYPVMSTSSGQFQPPSEYLYSEAQPPPQIQYNINVGDTVMAKYWEDGLFYEAVIDSMTPGLASAYVTYLEYGNTDEVMISDIRPIVQQMMTHQQGPMIPADMNVPPPQVFYTTQPVSPSGMEDVIQGVNSIEFRRGGGGAPYVRKDNRGQQQQYYLPMQQR
ncbi:tudor domain-containing protein 3 [Mactra antiquata]